MECVAPKMLAI